MFVKDFHDIKFVDVVTSTNELTTIDLTMLNDDATINDETSTKKKFAKSFRFEIMITKFCLTKNFCEIICWLNEFVDFYLFDKIIVVFMIFL